MASTKHSLLKAAYLFYYGTDVAFTDHAEEDGRLKRRLEELVADLLIIADKSGFDVVNTLTMMDNMQFLESHRVSRFRRAVMPNEADVFACSSGRATVFSTTICTTGARHPLRA